ncbi:HNH endonuclease [Streptomyces durhamensis]|uniref:HNH endonuclease n=1 Tax=Streptomyces durhamensis TaxID=68194 RepID=UPI0004CD4C03|nr:HNH endonuclease [Streptomyces durhamensis]
MTAWLVLAKAGSKRISEGYDDNPATHYSWDSTVPNHGRLNVGDVIVLWDGKELLGLSVIEDITVGQATKTTPFCLKCKKADVAERKKKLPRFVCWNQKCKHEDEKAGWKTKQVTTYRSRHEAGWIPARGELMARRLRQLCVQEDSQNSLRELRWDDFRHALTHSGTPLPLRIIDTAQDVIASGHTTATIRVRKGQPAFRKHLLEVFGEVCAFTGPAPAQALEAAHLYSYAANGKHHKGGGLLLRRDLHRLFDLGLIAVNPKSKTLHLADALKTYPDYAKLDGAPLTVSVTADHLKWLARHWNMHRVNEPSPVIPPQSNVVEVVTA